MSFKSNSSSFLTNSRKAAPRNEKNLGKRLTIISKIAHKSLIDKTPVYTGQSVRNFIMTMDNPNQGSAKAAIGSGPTGSTNSMSLGSEPRRGANMAAALATQSSLDFSNPFRRMIITNSSPAISGLERGQLPGKGKTSRSPRGMFAITMQEISERVRSGAL